MIVMLGICVHALCAVLMDKENIKTEALPFDMSYSDTSQI